MDVEMGKFGVGVAVILAAALPTVPIEDICDNLGEAICWTMGWNGEATSFADRYDFGEKSSEND